MTRQTDLNGRPYALLSELKEGDMIELDGGFGCVHGGTVTAVKKNENGELYFECTGDSDIELNADAVFDQQHLLDGQLDYDKDTLVGVYHAR